MEPSQSRETEAQKRADQERIFHLVMGALLLMSFFLDQQAAEGGWWDPPRISMITMVLGMVWVGRYAWGIRAAWEEREKVLQDRLERLERKADMLEDELERRRSHGSMAIDPGRKQI